MKYKLLLVAFSWLSILNIKAQDVFMDSGQLGFTKVYLENSDIDISSFTTKYVLKEKSSHNEKIKIFMAYEFGEAIFNKFQSISWELGVKFRNGHMTRLVHMDVNLTESHLSSSFAGAVDGNNVEGDFFGFEGFYDFPIFFRGFYLSPSFGYYRNEYFHTKLDENLKNESITIGGAISFRENDILNINGLYYMVSIPMRTPLNPIKETKLGETIIKDNTFDNNIWLFIGYEF